MCFVLAIAAFLNCHMCCTGDSARKGRHAHHIGLGWGYWCLTVAHNTCFFCVDVKMWVCGCFEKRGGEGVNTRSCRTAIRTQTDVHACH